MAAHSLEEGSLDVTPAADFRGSGWGKSGGFGLYKTRLPALYSSSLVLVSQESEVAPVRLISLVSRYKIYALRTRFTPEHPMQAPLTRDSPPKSHSPHLHLNSQPHTDVDTMSIASRWSSSSSQNTVGDDPEAQTPEARGGKVSPTPSSRRRAQNAMINARVIADATIGLSDGLTVPFALTAGLSALGSTRVVIFGGLAELIAGAISMGLGGYLGAKSEL